MILDPLNDCRSRNALQIIANAFEPKRGARADEPPHVILLPVAELHHKPATRCDLLDRCVKDATDVAEAVRPAE